MKYFRQTLFTFCALVIATLLAEGLLQLVRSKTIDMTLWFSGAYAEPNAHFGFNLKPNYEGYMRHRDSLFESELTLDAYGLRRPVMSSQGHAKNVLLLGGESMVFSYGLSDDEMLASQIAQHSKFPLNIRTASLPGMDIYRTWHYYREFLEGNTAIPDLVIISIFDKRLYSYRALPADLEQLPQAKDVAELFAFSQSVLNYRGGALALRFRDLYTNSFLAYRFGRVLDGSDDNVSHREQMELAFQSDSERIAHARRDFERLLERVVGYFKEKGSNVGVVFLPTWRGGPNYFKDFYSVLPKNVGWFDLQANCSLERHWIASGHYSEKDASILGGCMATLVDYALSEPVAP